MILFSSSSALLWKTFLARSESSAAVPALSSLATAATIFSSVFSRSSSRPDTLLVSAFISSSVAASCFSFSSSCRVAMERRSEVTSSSVSSCLDLITSSSTSSHHFLLSLLKILLKAGHSPGERVHLQLRGRQLLLLLLQLQGGDGETLGSDVQLGLKLPRLDQQLLHLVLALLGADPGRLHLLLADVRLVASVVLLHLHRLHLLLDRLHCEELKFRRK